MVESVAMVESAAMVESVAMVDSVPVVNQFITSYHKDESFGRA